MKGVPKKKQKDGLEWLGRGEMSEVIRSKDWSKTPLGPIETWSDDLRTTVSLCLASNFPINIIWGPQHIQVYNDGYRVVCGAVHPRALGESYTVTWASAWPAIGKPFERALSGDTSFLENQRMFLERNGYFEETFFTFSLSPIRDQSGAVVGLFHPVTETTAGMLAERRIRVLRDIATKAGKAKNPEEACSLAFRALADCVFDLPFALVYFLDDQRTKATLTESIRAVEDPKIFPPSISFANTNEVFWPFSKVASTGKAELIENIEKHFASLPCGEYPEPIQRAFLLPLFGSGSEHPNGLLLLGVSTRLPLDDVYRTFIEMLGASVNTVINDARAFQEEQKRAEALAEIDRSKTAFFSNVSHEFRTPLTLMLGPIEDALADNEHLLGTEQRGRLELAHRNALRLLKLVNSLLDFSRIEAGRMQAVFESTDLPKLTENIASVFRSAIENAGLQFTVKTSSLGESVFVDQEMWEKIILNLLSNAFKFTFKGEIEVGLKRVGDHAELTVRDTGTGIPEGEVANLFKRFHRIEGAQGRSHEGTGIGLALIQDLAKMHGGTIIAQSEVGVGTQFTVRIPFGHSHLPADQVGRKRHTSSTALRGAAFVEEALRWLPSASKAQKHTSKAEGLEALPHHTSEMASELANGPDSAQGKHPAKILLADDNSDMRNYVMDILSTQWSVTAVGDGEAAFEAALIDPPDLILSDIMMPKLDGFGLLQKIRSNKTTKAIPVILLSARSGEESKTVSLQAGADDFLVKPFSVNELLSRIKIHLELSRHRRNEERAREERFERVTDAANLGVWYCDLPFADLNWNERAKEHTWLAPNAHVTIDTFYRRIHPEDRLRTRDAIEFSIQNRAHFDIEYRTTDPNDEHQFKWIRAMGWTDYDDQGTPTRFDGVTLDISLQKKVEAEVKFAVEEARLANQAKTQFLANMSHEIRTPLGVIQGFVDLVLDPDVTSEEKINFLLSIKRNAQNLTKILGEVLDLSKIEAGKLEIEKIRFSLSTVIGEVISLLALRAKEKGIELRFESNDSIQEFIHSDPTRLRQILVNLIGNAVKFTNHGQVVVQVKNLPRLKSSDPPQLEFSISDSGIGISLEEQTKLFKPFSQADSSMNRKFGGTGLGLVLSKRLAQALGGDLVLRSSEPGKGSVFTFVIDAGVDPKQSGKRFQEQGSAGTDTLVSASPRLVLQDVRVLAVEDSPDNQILISKYLTQTGAKVTLANNGKEGVRKAQESAYDVIVMDVQMPEMDGYEATAELRKSGFQLPIIALTAHALSEERERALRSGFTVYLTKPLNKDLLIETIVKYASR